MFLQVALKFYFHFPNAHFQHLKYVVPLSFHDLVACIKWKYFFLSHLTALVYTFIMNILQYRDFSFICLFHTTVLPSRGK